MKKLILLFVCAFALVSCEIEDEDTHWVPELAEVSGADLPEFFEEGATYDIDVQYLLPSACHRPDGLNVQRKGGFGADRRKIYIVGVASYEYGSECDEEDDDLERESSFRIRIDQNDPYTFYLWTGVDDDGKHVYTTVEVPVGEPETPAEGEE